MGLEERANETVVVYSPWQGFKGIALRSQRKGVRGVRAKIKHTMLLKGHVPVMEDVGCTFEPSEYW